MSMSELGRRMRRGLAATPGSRLVRLRIGALWTPIPDRGPEGPPVPDKVRDATNRCINGLSPWPLLIHGRVGCGKTWCARRMHELPKGFGGMYLEFGRWCDELIEARDGDLYWPDTGAPGVSGPQRKTPESMRWCYRTANLVTIDELGKRDKASPFQCETLQGMLDDREFKPTILIANHGLLMLSQFYGECIASRIGAGTQVEYVGPDRRMKGGG